MEERRRLLAANEPYRRIRGRQVIQREGEYWTIVFAGETCRLRDGRGLRHLAQLLTHPHEPIPVLDFVPNGAEPLSEVEGPETARRRHERARINVTRAIASTLARIASHHPALAQHLTATIKTGNVCRYTPDPRLSQRWVTDV